MMKVRTFSLLFPFINLSKHWSNQKLTYLLCLKISPLKWRDYYIFLNKKINYFHLNFCQVGWTNFLSLNWAFLDLNTSILRFWMVISWSKYRWSLESLLIWYQKYFHLESNIQYFLESVFVKFASCCIEFYWWLASL